MKAEADGRRPFRYKQFIAPFVGSRTPEAHDFFDVQGYDISSDGFSFLTSDLPGFDKLIIALGAPPQATFLSARVVNIEEMSEQDDLRYHVNCEFIMRLDDPEIQRRLTVGTAI